MAELSIAPWTAAEVESLNAFQASGVMHPFTCGSDGGVLRAAEAGWECPTCDRQNGEHGWAHVWMADGSWRTAFPMHPLEAIRRRADG